MKARNVFGGSVVAVGLVMGGHPPAHNQSHRTVPTSPVPVLSALKTKGITNCVDPDHHPVALAYATTSDYLNNHLEATGTPGGSCSTSDQPNSLLEMNQSYSTKVANELMKSSQNGLWAAGWQNKTFTVFISSSMSPALAKTTAQAIHSLGLQQRFGLNLTKLSAPTATAPTTAPPTTVPATTVAPTTTTAPSPTTVVQDYFAAINAHDYQTAWALGGDNLGGNYTAFVQGFSNTAQDSVTSISSQGNTVYIAFVAAQDSGPPLSYQGTYTVNNGVIVSANIQQTTSTGPAPTTAAPNFTSFAGTWIRHDSSGLAITAAGAGSIGFPDYSACPTCAAATAPTNTITFQLTTVSGDTASGSVTSVTDSSDPMTVANTPVTPGASVEVTPVAGDQLQLDIGGSEVSTFCGSQAAVGACGA